VRPGGVEADDREREAVGKLERDGEVAGEEGAVRCDARLAGELGDDGAIEPVAVVGEEFSDEVGLTIFPDLLSVGP
jgi:hypothetical protein